MKWKGIKKGACRRLRIEEESQDRVLNAMNFM